MNSLSVGCYTPAGVFKYFFAHDLVEAGCRISLESVAVQIDYPAFSHYLWVFFLTCLLESPFYYLALKKQHPKILKVILILLTCNLATHPIVYFLLPYLGLKENLQYIYVLIGAEIFAPLVEIFLIVLFFRANKIGASGLIFIANIFSWWIGVYLT